MQPEYLSEQEYLDSSAELAAITRELADILDNAALPDSARARLRSLHSRLDRLRQQTPPDVSPHWNQELFTSMAERLPVGILIVEMPAETLYCNQAALDMLGLTREQVVGKGAFDAVWNEWATTQEDGTPISAAAGNHPTMQAIQTRQPVRNFVMGIYRPHLDSRIWVQINIEPILDAAGNVERVIAGFFDITERKQTEDALRLSEVTNRAVIAEREQLEQALRASNERYDRAISAAAAGVWDWDIDSDHIYIAPSLMTLLGFEHNLTVKSITHWIEQIHPDDQDRALATLAAHLEGNTPIYELEYRVTHPDGSIHWVLTRGSIMRDQDNAPYRMIGTTFDITALKQAEAALRQSEARNRALLNTIPDMMIRYNREGMYIEVKPAADFEPLLPVENLYNRTIDDILPVEVAELTHEKINTVLATGEMAVYEYQLEQDGIVRDFEGRMIADSADEVLLIIRDISERRRAEQARLDQERMYLLKTFINDVSHDLRTPISSLMTSTYLLHKFTMKLTHISARLGGLLLSHPATDANALLEELSETAIRIDERASTLEGSAKRLHTLIESMIEMVKLEGEKHYDLQLEDLNLLTQRVVTLMQPLAAAKSLTLTFEPQDRLVPAFVEEVSISRVVQNLIDNAIQYTLTGGAIEVRTYTTDQAGVIEVRDTGIGIATEHLPYIFDRFYRVDKARPDDRGGMGLGLAIVKTIVEAHNGEIEVVSQMGEGSTFRVIIPN